LTDTKILRCAPLLCLCVHLHPALLVFCSLLRVCVCDCQLAFLGQCTSAERPVSSTASAASRVGHFCFLSLFHRPCPLIARYGWRTGTRCAAEGVARSSPYSVAATTAAVVVRCSATSAFTTTRRAVPPRIVSSTTCTSGLRLPRLGCLAHCLTGQRRRPSPPRHPLLCPLSRWTRRCRRSSPPASAAAAPPPSSKMPSGSPCRRRGWSFTHRPAATHHHSFQHRLPLLPLLLQLACLHQHV
jgi:hypothetical protein